MWTHTKRFLGIFWYFLAVFVFLVGLSGVPGDIQQWTVWVSAMVENPIVLKLAEAATDMAAYINYPFSRVILVFVGLIIFAWPMRWFWRFRYKLWIWGRSQMSDQVWVSKDNAINEIKHSDWGRLKEPYVGERRPIVDFSLLSQSLTHERTISGIPPSRKAAKKFQLYIEATLRAFHKSNPEALRRNDDGTEETEVNTLRKFLQEVLDSEISAEFGEVPGFKVT